MKIIMFTKYDRNGASSRLRSYGYISYFKNSGISVSISNLFDSEYLKKIYSIDLNPSENIQFTQSRVPTRLISKGLFKVIIFYFRRIFCLLTLRKYQFIWIEKELFPYLPPIFEICLGFVGRKIIVDFDDAVFEKYRNNPSKVVRLFLKNKIAVIMRRADLVIVGNHYLYEYAKNVGAKKIILVPTVLEPNKYECTTSVNMSKVLTIGWIGTPATEPYLKSVISILEQVYLEVPNFKLVIVGGSTRTKSDVFPVEIHPWSESTEVELISTFSIGIMPLPDEPYEKGKCAYKVLQYMACGVPAIASPVGANNFVICHGKNGYLALTRDEWRSSLLALLKDEKLRSQIGAQGKITFLDSYTVSMGFSKIFDEIKCLSRELSL